MRAARHKRLALALIAAVLAARAVCVCAAPLPPAAGTATRDPHACCHARPTPAHHEPSGAACPHCSHAQLTPPDAFHMAAPAWTVVPLGATAPAVVAGRGVLAGRGPSARDAVRPPPATRRSCVLLI